MAQHSTFQNRVYQTRSIERAYALLSTRSLSLILVAPTASGKTTIAVRLVHMLGGRVLFLAHRIELIEQAADRLRQAGLDVGIVGKTIPTNQVVVGSVQKMCKRQPIDGLGLIVIDEAHRAVGNSYKTILEAHPGVNVLGLTATPYRADGKGLSEVFDEMVVVATPRELMNEGYIATPRVMAPTKIDYAELKRKGRDFDMDDAAEAMVFLSGRIVKHWLDWAQSRPTVVYACNIKHSKSLTRAFLDEGVSAAHLDGTTPLKERVKILTDLREGRVGVVCNVGVLTEGWDLPSLSVCVLARPTMSTGLYLQMVGRVLRPLEGKDKPLILDHAGCVREHGKPQDHRSFSLEGGLEKKGKRKRTNLRVCDWCGAVGSVNDKACNDCRMPFREMIPGVDESNSELVELLDEGFAQIKRCVQGCGETVHRRAQWGAYWHRLSCSIGCTNRWVLFPPKIASTENKQIEYEFLLRECLKRRNRLGWAKHKYRAIFGVWPRGLRGNNDAGRRIQTLLWAAAQR